MSGKSNWHRRCSYCFQRHPERTVFVGNLRLHCQLCGRDWKPMKKPPEGTIGVSSGIEVVEPVKPVRNRGIIWWRAFRRRIKRMVKR